MLSHEKMIVYQHSIDFFTLVTSILKKFPKGNAAVADQLKRAAMSIPLNIAEAAGRTSPADNARHFSIARGSALECGAVFDVCQRLDIIHGKDFEKGKDLLHGIVGMLSKLCTSKGGLGGNQKR